jgi:tetratricopeptide (TPR) repeat protein
LQALGYEYNAIEDFTKAIEFSPNNCNLFYMRALSKDVILDYEGEIKDIEKAIELSKQDTIMNRQYNESAINNGFTTGVIGMYKIALFRVKSRLEFDKRDTEKEYRNKQLQLIKRR